MELERDPPTPWSRRTGADSCQNGIAWSHWRSSSATVIGRPRIPDPVDRRAPRPSPGQPDIVTILSTPSSAASRMRPADDLGWRSPRPGGAATPSSSRRRSAGRDWRTRRRTPAARRVPSRSSSAMCGAPRLPTGGDLDGGSAAPRPGRAPPRTTACRPNRCRDRVPSGAPRGSADAEDPCGRGSGLVGDGQLGQADDAALVQSGSPGERDGDGARRRGGCVGGDGGLQGVQGGRAVGGRGRPAWIASARSSTVSRIASATSGPSSWPAGRSTIRPLPSSVVTVSCSNGAQGMVPSAR